MDDFTFWMLVMAAACWFLWSRTTGSTTSQVGRFEPKEYAYEPSAEVIAHLRAGEEVLGIRRIRAETGLGLRDGRDFYAHLRTTRVANGTSVSTSANDRGGVSGNVE